MSAIHFFDGISGGIGKSTVCAAAIAFHQAHTLDYVIFDSDRSKPDIYKAHKDLGCQLAILSEAERLENGANPIFEAAFDKPVLVNLSAASFIPLTQWITNNDLLMLAKEYDITFYQWFVLDGTPTSNKLLIRSLEHFKGAVRHIAVKNHGKSADWTLFDQDKELAALLTRYDVPTVDFPKFIGEVERKTMAEQNLSLLDASHYKGFGIISRSRVKKFIRESAIAFEQVGVFE